MFWCGLLEDVYVASCDLFWLSFKTPMHHQYPFPESQLVPRPFPKTRNFGRKIITEFGKNSDFVDRKNVTAV
jgi:hypothetical protein